MPRIILINPFMKHYAGSVFDLEINNQRASWDLDERLYERLPAQKSYILPDGGKGFALDLPFNDTRICPPSVFEGVDLTTGPCRITSAQTQSINDKEIVLNQQINIDKTALFDIDGNEKQGIEIQLPTSATPQILTILNRQNSAILKEIKTSNFIQNIDFKDFTPGFYEIIIQCKNDIRHHITFIKCFPLVVTLNTQKGTFTTMKTIY